VVVVIGIWASVIPSEEFTSTLRPEIRNGSQVKNGTDEIKHNVRDDDDDGNNPDDDNKPDGNNSNNDCTCKTTQDMCMPLGNKQCWFTNGASSIVECSENGKWENVEQCNSRCNNGNCS